MKKLFTLLVIVVMAIVAVPQKAFAEKFWLRGAYGEGNWPTTGYEMTSTDGNIFTYEFVCNQTGEFRFRITGQKDDGTAFGGELCPGDYRYELPTTGVGYSTSYNDVVNTDNYYYVQMTEGTTYIFKVDDTSHTARTVSCTISDVASYTDTEFEMVATCNGETVVLPLTAMRYRNEPETDTNKGKLSATHFAVGFKDEILPGKFGDAVSAYVRGRNNHNAVYRPAESNSTLGEKYTLANNTNLTDFRNATYVTGTVACESTNNNAFIIKKGTGVSYTVGLNLGEEITAAKGENSVSYTIKAKSLTLYTNKSIDAFYFSLYPDTYKNKSNVTKKQELEDYYLFGTIYGTTSDDEDKGNYMYAGVVKDDNHKYGWNDTDGSGTKISTYFKMEKQIYLNPNDKNMVDSIVYSKAIKKPANGHFSAMYMTFAPSSLIDGDNLGRVFNNSGADGMYKNEEKWNLVIRPEVFGQKDGTAVTGATLIAGYNDQSNPLMANESQSLNPLVDDTKGYYIVRLNTTTSTYRIEFVDEEKITISKAGIRTFCSRFNYDLPSDNSCAAYSAHSFKAYEDNKELNGQPNGDVYLRRLKFIPANEPVVLIHTTYFRNPEQTGTVEIPLTMITDGAGDPNKRLDIESQEEWWSNYDNYKNDVYHNMLVGVLDDEVIPNGMSEIIDNQRHYYYRNFALSKFRNTKYYKQYVNDESKDYIGFFRVEGKIRAGYAYLRVTDEDLNFNGQLLGDLTDNGILDQIPNVPVEQAAPSKFSFAFDIAPWENTTAIKEVNCNTQKDSAYYYTLQGTKVMNPSKGIFIHNGKKVIIK